MCIYIGVENVSHTHTHTHNIYIYIGVENVSHTHTHTIYIYTYIYIYIGVENVSLAITIRQVTETNISVNLIGDIQNKVCLCALAYTKAY